MYYGGGPLHPPVLRILVQYFNARAATGCEKLRARDGFIPSAENIKFLKTCFDIAKPPNVES